MLILEGKCPHCFGNLILGEEDHTITCEDCEASSTARSPNDLARMLAHCGIKGDVRGSFKDLWKMLKVIAKDYGPKEKRCPLTLAGKGLIIAFEKVEIPVEAECEEIDDAIDASRGLIDNEEKIKHLIKEGFLMMEE